MLWRDDPQQARVLSTRSKGCTCSVLFSNLRTLATGAPKLCVGFRAKIRSAKFSRNEAKRNRYLMKKELISRNFVFPRTVIFTKRNGTKWPEIVHFKKSGMMSAQLCDFCSSIWCLLNCMISAYLYDVCSTVLYDVLLLSVWCLFSCGMMSANSILIGCLLNGMVSAYMYSVRPIVWFLPTCMTMQKQSLIPDMVIKNTYWASTVSTSETEVDTSSESLVPMEVEDGATTTKEQLRR
jgi:hypothetical protein